MQQAKLVTFSKDRGRNHHAPCVHLVAYHPVTNEKLCQRQIGNTRSPVEILAITADFIACANAKIACLESSEMTYIGWDKPETT